MSVESLPQAEVEPAWLIERQSVAASPDVSGVVEAAQAMEYIIDRTPLEDLEFASEQSDNHVVVKREDQTNVRSFKSRGAFNKMRQLTPEQRAGGVVTVSAGNHSQGAAMSAWLLDMPLDVYMPITAPKAKVEATERWGARVIQVGDNYSQTVEIVRELLQDDERVMIPAYDDEDVIDGQGTVALELLEQLEGDDLTADYVFIPGGGGGLAAGMAKYIKSRSPDTKVIVVEPEDSNAIQRGYEAGYPVPLPHEPGIFADGVAVKQAGDKTLPYILDYVDGVMTVTQDEIIGGMTEFVNEKKSVIEGAAGCSIAGMLKYAEFKGLKDRTLVTLATGAGIPVGKLGEVLIRGEELTGHEALFTVHIPEATGSLRRFGQEVVDGHNITEMTYSRNGPGPATIQIGFSMNSNQDKQNFVGDMETYNYAFTDRSQDEDFNRYERHLITRSSEPVAELPYVITLPDRPGALMDLLDRLGDQWDITEFIYRTDRSASGAVAISFAATSDRYRELETDLGQTGFAFRRRGSVQR